MNYTDGKLFGKPAVKLNNEVDRWWGDLKYYFLIKFNTNLGDNYIDRSLKTFASIKDESYYVQMAVGWAFATALAKQNEKTKPYIFNKKINRNVNKIAIQKAIESRRISDCDKIKLKILRKELKTLN